MFSWLGKFIKHPLRVGAIAPSSSSLGRLMARDIPSQARVLEIGPGTGALTPFILERLASPSQLTLMEIDSEFVSMCQKKFPGTTVLQGDITELFQKDQTRYDAIVSGIPFAAMDHARVESLFKDIHAHLAPNGQFIMFQYSLRTLKDVKRIFGNAEVRFTPWNIPPAFVFIGKRTQ